MISQSVILAFDPKTADKEMQQIFANDLARVLWLAIRQGHMVTKNFNGAILKYAKIIEEAEQKKVLDAQKLFRILSSFAKSPTQCVIGPNEQVFAEELLPFVKGEKTITFKVV